MRDGASSLEAAGAACSQEEKDRWQDDSIRFMRKREADTEGHGAPVFTKAKKDKNLERLPSYDMLQMMHTSLQCHTNDGLEYYLEQDGKPADWLPPFYFTGLVPIELVPGVVLAKQAAPLCGGHPRLHTREEY